MKKLILLVMVIILGGCQLNSNDKKDSDMKTYVGVEGKVEIPKNPERIVADYYVGELLTLEANLVGGDLTYKSSAWGDKLKGVEDIGQSLEKITELKPDLIITINADKVDQYKEIAPTILIPYGTYNPEELLVELGKIVNKANVAKEWNAKFDNSIKELESLVDSSKTITIIDFVGKDAYYYGEHFGRGGYILYNKLGIKGTADAEKNYIRKPDSYQLLTIESLPKYAGDILFLMEPKDNSADTKNITESAVWNELPAVKSNSYKKLASEDFWYTDPYSLELQVKILKEILSEK